MAADEIGDDGEIEEGSLTPQTRLCLRQATRDDGVRSARKRTVGDWIVAAKRGKPALPEKGKRQRGA